MPYKYSTGPADVRAALANFEQRKSQIRRNSDLSAEGQQKQLAELKNQTAAYRPKAFQALDLAWKLIRQSYKALQEQAQAAEEAEAKRWDFARLTYEREAARSAIKTAVSDFPGGPTVDFAEARRLYDQAVNSGDTHRARAWLELAPEAFAARFSATNGGEVNRLAKDAAARLDAIKTTDAIRDLQAKGQELTLQAYAAKKATDEAGLFFDPGANPAFGGYLNEFAPLLSGVEIQEKLDVETLNVRAFLTITGEAPADGDHEDYEDRRARLIGG